MAFAKLASVKKVGNTDSTSIDTNTTVATLIVAFVHYYPPGGLGATPITDSQSNTWIPITAYANPNTGNFRGIKGYYCINPSTSATHTFRTNTSSYGAITVLAFSGTSPTFETELGNGQDSGASIQPGSITPTTSSDLFVASVTTNTNSIYSFDSGFTQELTDSGSAVCSFTTGYKIKSASSSAENPTIGVNSVGLQAATMMTFYEGGGAAFIARKPIEILQAVNRASTY